MKYRQLARVGLTAAMLLLPLSGCAVQRWAVNKAGDALSGGGTAFAADNDPQFVRAAAPFSLKLIETLLDKSPRHEGMLLSAASGFTQYAYAFIQQDAEMLAERDFAASQTARERARRMYLRARDYGLRGLETRHPGFSGILLRDPPVAAAVTTGDDTTLLYWTAVSWAAAIGQSKDDPDLIGDLPTVDALVNRLTALDPDFNHGTLQGFLITWEMVRAARADVARAHYERAVALSNGRLVSPFLALAEAVCLKTGQRDEFIELLSRAVAIDPDRQPEDRLENLVMQSRARWLLARVDDLFLSAAPTVPEEVSQ